MLASSLALNTLPAPTTAVVASVTSKSLNEFGTCFAAAQARTSRAFWFVPDERGGRFSDAGTIGVFVSYEIRFIEDYPGNRLEFTSDREGPTDNSAKDSARSCS